jgi:hypothetical protein
VGVGEKPSYVKPAFSRSAGFTARSPSCSEVMVMMIFRFLVFGTCRGARWGVIFKSTMSTWLMRHQAPEITTLVHIWATATGSHAQGGHLTLETCSSIRRCMSSEYPTLHM